MFDGLIATDARVLQGIATARTPGATRFFLLITDLGNGPAFALIAVLALLALWLLQKRRMAAFLLLGSATGLAGFSFLKWLTHRARPPADMALILQTGYSFPSGHAVMATVFYGLLGYFIARETKSIRFKMTIGCVAVLLILLIGFSRVYLGVHWASDVLAGWLLGGTILFVLTRLFRRNAP